MTNSGLSTSDSRLIRPDLIKEHHLASENEQYSFFNHIQSILFRKFFKGEYPLVSANQLSIH